MVRAGLRIETADVFAALRPELDRVEARLLEAASIDFPLVSEMVRDLVRAGGKRLRPLVLLLAGRAYRYDLDALVTAAAGVELLHTASLIHDDSIDRAALRRGKPTLNTVLSSGGVILIGDFLFAQSAILAAATNDPRVVAIFASTLADICDGQLREMFEAHRLEQRRVDYERRIYGKTAALFAGSAEMGAVIGGAPETEVQALRAFGADLGMAFQIVDDVLDLREETSQLGKPAGHDLRQGTVTLPVMLYAAGLANDSPERARLGAVVAGDLDDEASVGEVVAAIRRSGAIDGALRVAEEFVQRAKERASVVPDPETVRLLHDVADLALARTS
jgi:geranylgeranyl pyrophosphate synthase